MYVLRYLLFHTSNIIECKLSKNTTTLETPLSPIGYAVLIMIPLMYLQYVPVPFLFPPNTSPIPAHAVGTTAHKMTNATNFWQYPKIAYNTYKAMDCVLKSQLLKTIDSMFLDGIHTGPVGFATWATRDLLHHPYQTYSQVTPLDLRKNDLSMWKPNNSATPIEIL